MGFHQRTGISSICDFYLDYVPDVDYAEEENEREAFLLKPLG